MPRPKRVDGLSIGDLQAMIRQRKSRIGDLRKARRKLQKQLDAVDRDLALLEGANGRARGGGTGSRPRNDVSLVDAIHAVLKSNGKPMRVGDITEKVQEAGYRSSSANFKGIVNQTLIKDKRFVQAERGVYGLK